MKHNLKPLIIIVHGWGFDTNVFTSLVSILEQKYRVLLHNLPGYHGEIDVSEYTLARLALDLKKVVVEPAIIIGWSMGGQVVVEFVIKFPEKVKKVVLITSTPCFGKKDGWDQAMERAVLENFVSAYNKQPKETLNKFSFLAAEGNKNSKNWIKQLKSFTKEEVSQQALKQGLEILLNTDQRDTYKTLQTPLLMIFGENDSLVPIGTSQEILKLNPHIKIEIINEAGHTPFLTHTEAVADLINDHIAG